MKLFIIIVAIVIYAGAGSIFDTIEAERVFVAPFYAVWGIAYMACLRWCDSNG